MIISEPMTLITDWLLAIQCVVLGVRLHTVAARTPSRAQAYLGAALLCTALAAFVGGASHGFAAHLDTGAAWLAWKVTVIAVGVTTLMFLVTAALSTLGRRGRVALIAVAIAQAAVYVVWMLRHDDFIWVIADYVPAMNVVLVLMLLAWWRGARFAPWMVAGILVSFVGAGVQAMQVAPHPSFNHNDLYHVVQMLATWLLYRGGMLLRDCD